MNEHLFHPGNLRGFKHLRSGGTFKNSMKSTLTRTWSSVVVDRVLSYLRTGDNEELAHLLERSPDAVGHPVVFYQIVHLWNLRRRLDKGDLRKAREEGASVDPQEEAEAGPAGTRQAAHDALHRLVSGWVRSLLPGWKVDQAKLPKKRGRKHVLTDHEKLDLFFAYRELLEKMKELHPMDLTRKTGENNSTFIRRVIPVVQRLGMPLWAGPVPEAAAQPIAAGAVKGRDVQKDLLAYGVLAYYTRKTPGSIKGIVQRVKRDNSDLRDW